MRLQKAHFEAYTAKAMLAWYCLSSLRRRVCRSGPVSGCADSYSEPARWVGRRDGPLLDALRLSCKNLTQSTDVVDGDPCGCSTSVKRRKFKPAACAIDDRVGSDHRRASDDRSSACIGRVVRCTAMVASSVRQLAPVAARCLDLSARGSRFLTLKPSESFRATPYPLSTLPWDLGAKRATGSGQMASWLSG